MQIDLIYIYKIIIQVKDFNKIEFSRNATSSKVYRLGSPKAKRHGRRLWDLNINTLSGYSELGYIRSWRIDSEKIVPSANRWLFGKSSHHQS